MTSVLYMALLLHTISSQRRHYLQLYVLVIRPRDLLNGDLFTLPSDPVVRQTSSWQSTRPHPSIKTGGEAGWIYTHGREAQEQEHSSTARTYRAGNRSFCNNASRNSSYFSPSPATICDKSKKRVVLGEFLWRTSLGIPRTFTMVHRSVKPLS